MIVKKITSLILLIICTSTLQAQTLGNPVPLGKPIEINQTSAMRVISATLDVHQGIPVGIVVVEVINYSQTRSTHFAPEATSIWLIHNSRALLAGSVVRVNINGVEVTPTRENRVPLEPGKSRQVTLYYELSELGSSACAYPNLDIKKITTADLLIDFYSGQTNVGRMK